MKNLEPYLRYIATTDYLPNKFFVKAYDCRFFFVLSGKGVFKTETESYPLSANMLVYYPSGTAYFLSSDPNDPMMFVTVNFDFSNSYPRYTSLIFRGDVLELAKIHYFKYL